MLDRNKEYIIEKNGDIRELLFCGYYDRDEKPISSLQKLRNEIIDEFTQKLNSCDRCVSESNEVFVVDDIYKIVDEMRKGKENES